MFNATNVVLGKQAEYFGEKNGSIGELQDEFYYNALVNNSQGAFDPGKKASLPYTPKRCRHPCGKAKTVEIITYKSLNRGGWRIVTQKLKRNYDVIGTCS